MSDYTFSWVPTRGEDIEEEIEEEIQEEIQEEIEEEIEAIVEDPLEEPAISNSESYCYTSFSEENEKEYVDEAFVEDYLEEPAISNRENYCYTPISEEDEKKYVADEEIEEKTVHKLAEKDEEQSIASKSENYSYTPFTEASEIVEIKNDVDDLLIEDDALPSCSCSLLEQLKQAQKAKAALKEALEKEQRANSQIEGFLEQEKNVNTALEEALENEQRANFQIKESLKQEKSAKAALADALEKEQKTKYQIKLSLEQAENAKAAFEKALEKEQRDNSQIKESLKQEKNTKAALEEALEQEKKSLQAEQASSRREIEDLKTQIADLSKSLKKHRDSNEKLKAKMSKMLVDREEDTKVIKKLEKFKHDLEVSSSQRKNQIAERDKDISVQITAYNERIIKLQDESLSKDNEIQSLLFNIENLKGDIDSRDNTVSSLHEKVKQLMSNLKDNQSLICSLQKECDDAVAQQTSTDELDYLTRQNQQLSCENTKLQGDLKAALKEKKIAVNQLEEAKKGCSKNQEIIDKENTKFQKMLKKIQTLKAELLEKNVALEKSLTAKQHLKFSLKNEQKRVEKMLSQQAAANPSMFLSNQQRGANVPSEHIMYDMQTLKMENADIRAKFSSMEVEYEYKKHSLTEQYEEQIAKKNAIISDNQVVIDKLHSTVFDLKAQQSDSKFREKKLEDDLKQETQRCSRLQQRVDEIATSLQREQTICEKHRVELKEALTKQIEITEERHKLSVALQKAQDGAFRLQEQQQTEAMYQFRKLQDTELVYQQQKTALEESKMHLNNLRRDYADLISRHSDLNSNYCGVLQSHRPAYTRFCNQQQTPNCPPCPHPPSPTSYPPYSPQPNSPYSFPMHLTYP
ncbi:hypothetical protein PAMA_015935 [Pampus argenteus]